MTRDMLKKSLKLVLATGNPGKLKEFKALVEAAGFAELEVSLAPPGFGPEETGTTFAANALIKASEAARLTGNLSLADDSGICVDFLEGGPGVYSARYDKTDQLARTKLLAAMQDVPDEKRGAHFVSALALVGGDGKIVFTCQESWHGRIDRQERGEHGFGFDPLFIPEGYTITSAQMEPSLKNRLSHRAKAWFTLEKFLKGYLERRSQEDQAQ